MAKFLVHVEDCADYEVEAENEEEAIQTSWEWFIEREPDFRVEEAEKDA